MLLQREKGASPHGFPEGRPEEYGHGNQTGAHCAFQSGTTKRTLRAVAEGFGCSELSETDWADPKSRAAILKIGPDELVIAGMPVYYGRIPSLFHEGLPLRGEGTPFVPVAVYGNRHYDDAVL